MPGVAPGARAARSPVAERAGRPAGAASAGGTGSASVRSRIGRQARPWELAERLTDRDRQLCHLLSEHRVLTTGQIADVAFAGLRRAQLRLAELHQLEVVDRFRPRSWAGSGPYYFTLGPAGAVVVAADRGIPVGDLGWRRDAAEALAVSQRLPHTVGVNGFFTALLRAARTHPGCELAQWWSERRTVAAWGTLVRPDGYGIWVEDGVRLPFLLEYDLGTERLHRLAGKLDGYAALARAGRRRTWVLFAFLTPGREAAARAVLAHPLVPVATATLRAGDSPADPCWLIVGERGPRRRLADLARHQLPAVGPPA